MAAKTTPESIKQINYLAGRAQGAADHRGRAPGLPTKPGMPAGPTRTTSPPSSNAKSRARNASGAELRIRAAGFPARKTLEDFDWDAQPAVRAQVAALASGGFLTEARNVVLLGPPGTGKTHLAIALGHRRRTARTPGAVRDRDRLGHPAHRRPPPRPARRKNWPGCAATG